MGEGLRVVAFGGGTGLPVLLRGLRRIGTSAICAVVTVADDGGSSGRLRQELGVAPPGDVRNCLIALAGRRGLAEVFDYRFEDGVELREHSVGNIIIAALADMAGGFCEGVEQAGRFLRVKGSVHPAAVEPLSLVAQHADGSVTRGESAPRATASAIRRVAVEPAGVAAPHAVIRAIEEADVAVLSPGSLFTSTIPALLGVGVPEVLARTGVPVIYAANIMTQPGETTGFTLSDHLRAIGEHVGPLVTDVLVPSDALPPRLLERYRAEGAAPVRIDRDAMQGLGVRVHEARVLPQKIGGEARHDAARLARAVHDVAALTRVTSSPESARATAPGRWP
jgi:uncharacterized cofD-like protein